jgi:CRP-like cAMP-binding protein
MSLDNDLHLLSRVELFQGFPPEQLRLLAFGTERELLRAGRELFKQGDISSGGYVIAGGQIDLVIYRGSREVVLDSRHEGAVIGELGLITAAQRTTSAVARTNSEAMFIPRMLFHRMLNAFPQTAAVLHQRISRSVLHMLQQLEKLHETMEAAPRFPDRRDG